MWVYFEVLYSVLLIYMSVLLPIPFSVDHCGFIVFLRLGSVSPPTLFLSSILCWLFWVFSSPYKV